MNVVLWVIAGVLAAMFLLAGTAKLTQPKEKLVTTMAWTEDFSPRVIKLIGTLELLAAIGLILPAALDIAPMFVPLAAVGLVTLMLAAAMTHVRRREPQYVVINLVLATLALVVAWGRFGTYSFTA